MAIPRQIHVQTNRDVLTSRFLLIAGVMLAAANPAHSVRVRYDQWLLRCSWWYRQWLGAHDVIGIVTLLEFPTRRCGN